MRVYKRARGHNSMSVNFAVKIKSVKTVKIKLLHNLALYGILLRNDRSLKSLGYNLCPVEHVV